MSWVAMVSSARWVDVLTLVLVATVSAPARADQQQQILLDDVVKPSTVIVKDGQTVKFAIHGYIEFSSLQESFAFIDTQVGRWKGDASVDTQKLSRELVREAVESRVISMVDERPLQALVTHTKEELAAAIGRVKEPLPSGYAEAFLAVQEKWKHSLNCWSAAPSIPARVLSNWYLIEEGIVLHGATYDSTEHFWQAVKYHPDVTVGDVEELTRVFEKRDWKPWLARLDSDSKLYLPNAYAVEFLRFNLTPERMRWFREAFSRYGVKPEEHARAAQQRGVARFRFIGFDEKVLWGDLADVFQLVYLMSPADDPIRKMLEERHFDGIYLDGQKLGFISEEYRSQMVEIWKVKFLGIPRFREVIAGIPMEIKLSHFLNDGDSPDIPIPVYVGYLNRIREMARAGSKP
jgi:hypothetical protein